MIENILILIFATTAVNFVQCTTTFTLAIFCRLSQLERIINKPKIQPNNMNMFIRYHIKTLVLIETVNKLYSDVFLSFMIFEVPINIFTVVCIMFHMFTPFSTFIFGNIICYQYVVLFGIHLAAAILSNRIHRCSSRYVHHSVNYWKQLWLKNHDSRGRFQTKNVYNLFAIIEQIRISFYGETIHTNNRYGITYGPIQLITLVRFGKVLCFDVLVKIQLIFILIIFLVCCLLHSIYTLLLSVGNGQQLFHIQSIIFIKNLKI